MLNFGQDQKALNIRGNWRLGHTQGISLGEMMGGRRGIREGGMAFWDSFALRQQDRKTFLSPNARPEDVL